MEFRYKSQDVHFRSEQKKKKNSGFTYKQFYLPGEAKKEARKASFGKNLLEDIVLVCIVFLIGQFITQCLITNAYVPTGSMELTIPSKSRIIGNRLAYLNNNPERGDIIIFPYPDNEEVIYIKRIIGLPEETLEVIDGVVYINGVMLKEDYLKEKMVGNFGPYTIPKDCYFVMGDNRNDSLDARFWTNQFVEKDKIQSKAILMIYPEFKIFD